MPSLLSAIVAAAKILVPEGIEIYTLIHDRKTGKITILTQLDANSGTLQASIQELVQLKADLAKPLIP